jgi:hypothetical protein
MAVRRIKNGQPAHAEGGGRITEHAVIIGTAMNHGIAHLADGPAAHRWRYDCTDESGDAAHGQARLRPVTSGAKQLVEEVGLVLPMIIDRDFPLLNNG